MAYSSAMLMINCAKGKRAVRGVKDKRGAPELHSKVVSRNPNHTQRNAPRVFHVLIMAHDGPLYI